MPGRSYNSGIYRYAFNGKEKDKDFSSNYDYGFRIYNPRIARFLSVDPLTRSYPMLTPYQFASNSPIAGVDLDGLEFAWAQDLWDETKSGYKTVVKVVNEKYTEAAPVINAVGRGLQNTANDLAPIRQADENDPKTPGEAWESIKNIPSNLATLPSQLKKTYQNGTLPEKVEATVGIVGTVLALRRGKASPGAMNVVLAGYNAETRIVTFINKVKNIKNEVELPAGFEKVTVEGSKADVFKLKGKNEWISPDLDSHVGGIWKRATGKAENLIRRDTREGTYNADLSERLGK